MSISQATDGSPQHTPALERGPEPLVLADEALGLLESSQALKAQYDVAHEAARLAVQKAMRILIRPGDIVQRHGDRDSPVWLTSIRTMVGNDRNAPQFEIAGEVYVHLHETHSSLSTWGAMAYAINRDGVRLNGNTHHGRSDGTVEIKGHICRDCIHETRRKGVNEDLMSVIEAASLKASATPGHNPFSDCSALGFPRA